MIFQVFYSIILTLLRRVFYSIITDTLLRRVYVFSHFSFSNTK